MSSRILWVRIQLEVEKWVFVSICGPGSEKSYEENCFFFFFFHKLNECLCSFRENVKEVQLSDLNVRVGNESVMDVIGKCRVPGRNDCVLPNIVILEVDSKSVHLLIPTKVKEINTALFNEMVHAGISFDFAIVNETFPISKVLAALSIVNLI